MITYLIDSSALWRILRDDETRSSWSDAITSGAVGSCDPQRVEFRRSARNLDEYEQISAMFDELYPDVTVPKSAWRWIESAQYRLLRKGAHRAMSAVDLLICATATQQGLSIVHDDNDFSMAAKYLDDVRERRVGDLLGA